MKLSNYIKDNIISIIIYLFEMISVFLILDAFKMNKYCKIIVLITMIICRFLVLIINYYRRKSFYDRLKFNLENLSKKYLILETLPESNTYEQKILIESLYEINKSMIENINEYQKNINEFKEFVEAWIHEVKIPISSMVLKCHNNKDKYDKNFLSLIRKLDSSIDEVLYYVRSEDTEKDFSITEVNLKDSVKNVIIKNKDDLLDNNITFESNINNIKVFSDKKWIEFIINQIINNSIKYKKDKDSIIKISSYDTKESTILEIYDNGIGIPSKDIGRVFDKTFTGSNGRDKVKSTGMGLYIVKKLCNKLGHDISISSKEKEYTKVIIKFGKNNIYKI